MVLNFDHTADGPQVTIGQYSAAGRKERNDDSYGVMVPEPRFALTKGIAMAIADGVSSSEAAKEASETCVKSFLEDYYCTHESWPVKKSVATVLKAINSWLYGQGQIQYLSNRGMVSTFSGLILKAGTAYIFHAGDSRITLLRDRQLEPLTRDHRTRVSRQQDYLSRAIGIDPDLEIDCNSKPVHRGDRLVFTTDGIHDFLEPGRIVDIIDRFADDLDRAAHAIADAAYTAGSGDNLTCQIVAIEKAGRLDEFSHLRDLISLPFPPDLVSGQDFEGYRIVGELHASKRTQVYLAVDPETGQHVAIKTPSKNFEDDPAYIEMFMREEWVGRRVKSPHVVRVADPKLSRRFLYYVTEFVEGDTLRTWMQRNPDCTPLQVRQIADQIAAGLRAFHRKDMVHQDLKPENVVIDKFGSVKIIDFGSAHAAGLDEIGVPVEVPDLLGTQGYTAPEYHLGSKPTNRADIFSLGIVVYEMMTGKRPYGDGFTNTASVSKLRATPAIAVDGSILPWLSAALARATHRNPRERYGTLSEFCADLARPGQNLSCGDFQPLIERDPAKFWKWLALISILANLAILFAIGMS